jgi:hypothetical protein
MSCLCRHTHTVFAAAEPKWNVVIMSDLNAYMALCVVVNLIWAHCALRNGWLWAQRTIKLCSRGSVA